MITITKCIQCPQHHHPDSEDPDDYAHECYDDKEDRMIKLNELCTIPEWCPNKGKKIIYKIGD